MPATDWTTEEQHIARSAFEAGKKNSIKILISTLKAETENLETPESIWRFHDFLSTERFQYEGRSEFDINNILFTLAEMLRQNQITIENLKGLNDKKMSKIKAMSMF